MLLDQFGQPIPNKLQTGDDSNRDPKQYRHDLSVSEKVKNFDQKIYMFPESYNALRRELYENWQDTLWPKVAWRMAYKAEEFVEQMNAELNMTIVFDTEKVAWICEQYLSALRKKRGLSQ